MSSLGKENIKLEKQTKSRQLISYHGRNVAYHFSVALTLICSNLLVTQYSNLTKYPGFRWKFKQGGKISVDSNKGTCMWGDTIGMPPSIVWVCGPPWDKTVILGTLKGTFWCTLSDQGKNGSHEVGTFLTHICFIGWNKHLLCLFHPIKFKKNLKDLLSLPCFLDN